MTTIRIEIHNEERTGTYVRLFGGANWQNDARAWIKETAALIRSGRNVAVWAMMFDGRRSRRIEA
jgi:hypothetical protein